jgi:hypothetical protein
MNIKRSNNVSSKLTAISGGEALTVTATAKVAYAFQQLTKCHHNMFYW